MILYPATLLNLLIISASHLVESLRSIMYSASSTNEDDFTFLKKKKYTKICIPLFYALITPACALYSVLKRSVDRWHLCFAPEMNGMLQVSHQLGWNLLPVCHVQHSLCWSIIPLVLLSPGLYYQDLFIRRAHWIEGFSASIQMIMWFSLSLSSFMWFITFID